MPSQFPDAPAAVPFDIRQRLEWCLDVLDASKDECYEGMPQLESVARAIHISSVAVLHLAQSTSSRRDIPLDLLTCPVEDEDLMLGMLADAKDEVAAAPPAPLRPSEENKQAQAIEESDDGAVEGDGDVATTRGARTLIDEHNLDVNKLVREGDVVPTYCGPKGEDEPSVSKTDIRNYLGRPKNMGNDVGGTGNSGVIIEE